MNSREVGMSWRTWYRDENTEMPWARSVTTKIAETRTGFPALRWQTSENWDMDLPAYHLRLTEYVKQLGVLILEEDPKYADFETLTDADADVVTLTRGNLAITNDDRPKDTVKGAVGTGTQFDGSAKFRPLHNELLSHHNTKTDDTTTFTLTEKTCTATDVMGAAPEQYPLTDLHKTGDEPEDHEDDDEDEDEDEDEGEDEHEPRPDIEYDILPRRKKVRAEHAAIRKKQGAKRQTRHFQTMKGKLEVGDVVHFPVSHKHKTASGEKVIVGTIHKVLPHEKYKLLTQVGVLTSLFVRNQLQFQPNGLAAHLNTPPELAMLPMITECNALKILNPTGMGSIYRTCKKVHVVDCSHGESVVTLPFCLHP